MLEGAVYPTVQGCSVAHFMAGRCRLAYSMRVQVPTTAECRVVHSMRVRSSTWQGEGVSRLTHIP